MVFDFPKQQCKVLLQIVKQLNMLFNLLYSFMFPPSETGGLNILFWVIILLVSDWCMEHDWTARRRWRLRFSSSNNARMVLDITDVIELENTSENHSMSLLAQERIGSVYGTPDILLNLSWKTFKTRVFMIIPHNRFQSFTISLLGTCSWHLKLRYLVEI